MKNWNDHEPMTPFEKSLTSQPLSGAPPELRARTLAAARAAAPKPESRPAPSFTEWIVRTFRPWRLGWAGLGAAWIVVFALHQETRQLALENEPTSGRSRSVAVSAYSLRQHHAMLQELLAADVNGFDPMEMHISRPARRPRTSPLLLIVS